MTPQLTSDTQRTVAADDDRLDVHVDNGWPGLRPGEGRAGHDVLHAAPDLVLGHHHHDQHGLRRHLTPHLCREAGGFSLCHLRCSLHHSPHTNHRGKL